MSRERKWPVVAKLLGLDPKPESGLNVVAELKSAYAKIIGPFDAYLERVKINNVAAPSALYSATKSEPEPASRMGGVPSGEGSVQDQMKLASEKLNQALETDVDEGASHCLLFGCQNFESASPTSQALKPA